jgi:hypothetical protein
MSATDVERGYGSFVAVEFGEPQVEIHGPVRMSGICPERGREPCLDS